MARFKTYSYLQTKMVPISFEKQILKGTFEHTLSQLIDNEFDLSAFEAEFENDETGRPAWNPAILLKVILYAYSKGIISSRKIAEACEENVMFMALSADACPHFTTIARFISEMGDKVTELFRNVLLVCYEMDLIGGEMFAVDGCKLPSNASKEWSGTKAGLRCKKEKLEKALSGMTRKHRERDMLESAGDRREVGGPERESRLRAKIEKIQRFLEENNDKVGKRGKFIQSNVTDNESAKMKTARGVIQGYNGLSMVDGKHQIIVNAKAFGSGQEHALMLPMVEGAKENLAQVTGKAGALSGKRVLADTGFHSESNLKGLAEEGVDAYVPDSRYRQRDGRFKTAIRHRPVVRQFTIANFRYDRKENQYICPAGKRLRMTHRRTSFGGHFGRCYRAEKKDCRKCSLRENCLMTPETKQRYLYVVDGLYGDSFSRRMKEKIDTPRGREIYSRRMGIVEPVFGNITHNKRLDHFTLRGQKKVNGQWLLYNMVHNIEKISLHSRN